MSKLRFLTFSVIGLILINLSMAGYILFRKPPHPKHEGPRNEIIEKLGFDAGQQKQYDELISWHRSEITRADEEIMRLKNELYNNLTTSEINQSPDSLIEEICRIQNKIEHTHYIHFKDIREICHEDQLDEFNALTKELASLFAPHPHKKK